jgi:hypothetical protein
MANGATSNRLMSELIAARDSAERHLEDPDNSTLSTVGALRQLTDAVSTFLGPVIEALSAEPIELQPLDQWGRARCQEIHTYVDDPSEYQCAMTAGHAGECDPLPIEPAEQHEHHFPLGPNPENDPALYPLDCACGLTYQDYESDEFYRLSEQSQRETGS